MSLCTLVSFRDVCAVISREAKKINKYLFIRTCIFVVRKVASFMRKTDLLCRLVFFIQNHFCLLSENEFFVWEGCFVFGNRCFFGKVFLLWKLFFCLDMCFYLCPDKCVFCLRRCFLFGRSVSILHAQFEISLSGRAYP